MKRKLTQISLVITASLMLLSCGANTPSYVTPDNTKIAVFVACSGTILAVPEKDKAHVCDYIWSISYGAHTLASGHVPTPAEMQQMIATFGQGNEKWAELGVTIGTIWASNYPNVQGDPKVALEYLEAVSGGAGDAAKNCRTQPTQ